MLLNYIYSGQKKKKGENSSFKIPKRSSAFEPEASDSLGREKMNKFTCSNEILVKMSINTSVLLPPNMHNINTELEKLLLYSVTSSTWRRHSSAWNLYKTCCEELNMCIELPISITNMRVFVTWALSKRKLQASTVESYISSLNIMHDLTGNTCDKFSRDRCIQLALKGSANLVMLKGNVSSTRLSMNVHLLKLMGHRINEQNWDEISKQIIWTAGVISFYTSCRMGEIVADNRSSYDTFTTLKLNYVKFLDNSEILIFLPYTKTTGLKGAIVDIFPTKDSTCPVAAIVKTKRLVFKKKNV